jgi:hypothetical protein
VAKEQAHKGFNAVRSFCPVEGSWTARFCQKTFLGLNVGARYAQRVGPREQPLQQGASRPGTAPRCQRQSADIATARPSSQAHAHVGL